MKSSAADATQIGVGTAIYGSVDTALIGYDSDQADNYDLVNWPHHFPRCAALYFAQLVAPKLARGGGGSLGMLEASCKRCLPKLRGSLPDE